MPHPLAAFHATLTLQKYVDSQEYCLNKHHGGKQTLVVRLLGVDARDLNGPEREKALIDWNYAEEWLRFGVKHAIGKHDPFIVQTVAQDKYGRWLGWVWRECDGACLNIDLIRSGHANPAPASASSFLLRDVVNTAKGV